MVGVLFIFIGDQPHQPPLYGSHRLTWRQFSPVRYPEDMGIDGNSGYPKGGIQDHVGRLPANPWQGLQRGAITWHLAAMLLYRSR